MVLLSLRANDLGWEMESEFIDLMKVHKWVGQLLLALHSCSLVLVTLAGGGQEHISGRCRRPTCWKAHAPAGPSPRQAPSHAST